MEEEEEAEMEKTDIANDMAKCTKAVEAYKKCSATSPGTGRTKGTVSFGMSLCLHPPVSTMATKALPMTGPSLKFISL